MLGIMYHEGLKEYDFGPGHPLQGDRFQIFPGFLRKSLSEGQEYVFLTSEPVRDDDLRLICTQEYIDFTRNYYRMAHLGQDTGSLERFSRFHSEDNMPHGQPGLVEQAARLMIGLEKQAADLVMNQDYKKVLCFGGMHHAKPDYGEGFCIYNDVAFTAKYFLTHYDLERVLILDTDAHAGNGTSEYFYDGSKVLFIDIHQDPMTMYPGTGYVHDVGHGKGTGFTINIPMPMYAGDNCYEMVFTEIVEPIVREYKPQVVIRNGGSDPHFSDGLTNLGLTVEGFRMIGQRVKHIAEICGGRSIDLLGSGYNRDVLPNAWLALLSGLMGWSVQVDEPDSIRQNHATDAGVSEVAKVIERVTQEHGQYWSSI